MKLPPFLDRSVPEVFADIAAAHRESTALLADDGQRWTYAELESRAAAIANALRGRGIGRGDIVGLYMQRSPAAIAAMLGVLQAGAAYLPFDTTYPTALLSSIRDDADPRLVLVDGPADAPLFDAGLTLPLAELLATTSIAGTAETAGPEDPAYIMFTSGSTGRPKGVIVPHRAILRLVLETDYADFGPDQTFLQLAPLAFDASTFEIWGALLNGARLALAPPDCKSLDVVAGCIARHGVTTLWLTAGLFHLMVDHHIEALRPLRQLLSGGDVLSPSHVSRALVALPQCTLINGYGPTENTTFSCCHRIREVTGAPIPIGRPIANTTVVVMDEQQRPLPPGEIGELYVGGAGLALGYLNRPELTTERFVDSPTAAGRLYRTGDRVRQRPDGILEFLGRSDRQVKINGKRVELDEIESCMRRSGLVREVAVAARKLPDGQSSIEAWACLVPPAVVAELHGHLRAQLPSYMLPAQIHLRTQLPLTPTGKVDRRRLAEEDAALTSMASLPGGDALERELSAIWQALLPRPIRSLDDNFFDLGGSSLQMIAAHAQIRARLKPDASLLDLYRRPNLRSLAGWIRGVSGDLSTDDSRQRAQRQRKALAAMGHARKPPAQRPGVMPAKP